MFGLGLQLWFEHQKRRKSSPVITFLSSFKWSEGKLCFSDRDLCKGFKDWLLGLKIRALPLAALNTPLLPLRLKTGSPLTFDSPFTSDPHRCEPDVRLVMNKSQGCFRLAWLNNNTSVDAELALTLTCCGERERLWIKIQLWKHFS